MPPEKRQGFCALMSFAPIVSPGRFPKNRTAEGKGCREGFGKPQGGNAVHVHRASFNSPEPLGCDLRGASHWGCPWAGFSFGCAGAMLCLQEWPETGGDGLLHGDTQHGRESGSSGEGESCCVFVACYGSFRGFIGHFRGFWQKCKKTIAKWRFGLIS